MTTSAFDKRVDDNMLDVSRLGRYYLTVADRWRKWHLWLSTASIIGSLVAATVLLAPIDGFLDNLFSAVAFLSVSVTTTVMAVYDFSGRSQKARSERSTRRRDAQRTMQR